MTRKLFEISAVVVAIGLLLVFGQRTLGVHGYLLASKQPLFGDFIAFWSAGKAALEGHVAQLHDRVFLAHIQQSTIVGMRVMAPWNSPPPFLFFVIPFALLPYGVAAIVWLILTGALYLFAASKILPDKRALIFAITLPAALYHLGTEQVGLLIAGLNGLALYWLDKRPRAAGTLVGMLLIKPHLAILWPFLLLLTRRWNAFFAATVCTIVLIVSAGLVFGFDSYIRFFENLKASQDLIARLGVGKQTYGSLFGNLLALRVPMPFAIAGHAVSAVLAFAAALWVFTRKVDWRVQGAALCSAALLLSSYLFFYDFVLLGLAAALLAPPRDKFETAATVFAWIAGMSVAFSYAIPLPLCPFSAWLVLLAALRRTFSARAGSAALAPALAPQL
jgi:hypothetical protein